MTTSFMTGCGKPTPLTSNRPLNHRVASILRTTPPKRRRSARWTFWNLPSRAGKR